MLFLEVFIKIFTQFFGFSEQHQGKKGKNSREIVHVFPVQILQYDVNKFACVASKFVSVEFFSEISRLQCPFYFTSIDFDDQWRIEN